MKHTEVERIRDLGQKEEGGMHPSLRPLIRRGGTMRLHAIQREALWEISVEGGLLAPIAVGAGKGLISMLAPAAYGLYRTAKKTRGRVKALLLVPATLKRTYRSERAKFEPHFHVPDITVMSYAMLSRPDSARRLEELAPDIIICDEAHKLCNRNSARTLRVARYMDAHPETAFVALSGTLTKRSVLDYAHLAAWALKDGSPLPRTWTYLQSFSAVLDAEGQPCAQDYGAVAKAMGVQRTSRTEARAWYRDHLRNTPGVVASSESSIGASLILRPFKPEMPPVIEDALNHLEAAWESPNSEIQYEDAMQVAEAARRISQGFYYVWDWPNGEVDREWLEARRNWAREVAKITKRGLEGLDSERLVRDAVIASRSHMNRGGWLSLALLRAWDAWHPKRHKAAPPLKTIWLSTRIMHQAVEWAVKQKQPCIIWYRHRAVGEWLRACMPTFGPGEEPPTAPRTCALSIGAHGTGKNLQSWANQIVICPPSSGSMWEQLLGRTHRQGQKADEVRCSYLAHTKAFTGSLAKATRDARYIQETTGSPQKLLYCTRL